MLLHKRKAKGKNLSLNNYNGTSLQDTKNRVVCDEEKLPAMGLCASAIEWQAFSVSGVSWADGRCPFCEEEGKYQQDQSSKTINSDFITIWLILPTASLQRSS